MKGRSAAFLKELRRKHGLGEFRRAGSVRKTVAIQKDHFARAKVERLRRKAVKSRGGLTMDKWFDKHVRTRSKWGYSGGVHKPGLPPGISF